MDIYSQNKANYPGLYWIFFIQALDIYRQIQMSWSFLKYLSQQAHAPPRPLVTPASVASVVAVLCLKIHFFSGKFLGYYLEAAQNFIGFMTIFDRDQGQKTSLAKFVLKCSVQKQSLPNF